MSKASDDLLAALRRKHEEDHPYRSVKNDIQVILDGFVEEGLLRDLPAIRDDIVAHWESFTYDKNGRLIRDDGIDGKVALRDMIEMRPHLQPLKVMPDLVARACIGDENGVITLAARAALLRDVGGDLAAYREILAAHGCSEFNLKPGTAPVIKKDGTVEKLSPKAKARSENPYGWPASPERTAAIAALFSQPGGAKRAQALAAECDCQINGNKLRRAG
jgi:hypothetical protein